MSSTMTNVSNPTWYDLLDVEPDASTDEIRATWKSAVADLDPTDRRFRTLNDAAGVLLDEKKRKAYDAELAAAEEAESDEADAESDEAGAEDTPEASAKEPEADEVGEVGEVGEADEPVVPAEAAVAPAYGVDEPKGDEAVAGPVAVPLWALVAAGVLAVAAVVAAGVVYFGQDKIVTVSNDNTTTSTIEGAVGKKITQNHTTLVEESAADALDAAKKAAVPLLSYDYKAMPAAKAKAHAVMTKNYRDDYDRLFAVLVDNVPNTKTVVKTLAPVDAGIVRVGNDRVQVLVIVDRQVTNAERTQPVGYQEYATLTMAKVGGKWLVDDVSTTNGK